MMLLQVFSLSCVMIAIIAIIAKVIRYATAPQHMRWELYPVPHEKGRAEYGGSYLEELEWWNKPRQTDKINELKEMAEEIILLKGVFNYSRRVWSSSFPFHFGMYILIGWMLLLLIGGILQISGLQVSADAEIIGQIVHYATIVTGFVGMALTAFGAIGLFIWRATDDGQREFNAPIDYFNLLLLAAVCIVNLIAAASVDHTFAITRAYLQSTVAFSESAVPSALLGVAIGMMSFAIMWVTITRMSHFVAKYFLYHAVRWNDQPNERGSKIEQSLLRLLDQKVGWSAAHIQTGKSWSDVVKEMKNEH